MTFTGSDIAAIICIILLITVVPFGIWHEKKLIAWENRQAKKIKRFFKKTLDKMKSVWYNVITKNKERGTN